MKQLNFYFDFPYHFTEKEVDDDSIPYEPHDVMMQVTMCELYRKFKKLKFVEFLTHLIVSS